MKNIANIVIVIVLLLTVITIIPSPLNFVQESEGADVIVDLNGGGDWLTIQDGIINANAGDTVYVWDGLYNEDINIGKTLSLIGNGSATTIINGTYSDNTVKIKFPDYVNITGFTINGSGNTDAGIILIACNYTRVYNNVIDSNYHGIYINLYSSNNEIYNNTITNNTGSGINSWSMATQVSTYNNITNNYIGNNYDGVTFSITAAGSNYHNLSYNSITNNSYTGMSIATSDNIIFRNNVIDNGIQSSWFPSSNTWNLSYPIGGNYWSDYTGLDNGSGVGNYSNAYDGMGDNGIPFNGDNHPWLQPDGWNIDTKVVNTNLTHRFEDIQSAIDGATAGNVIQIYNFTFTGNFNINRQLEVYGNSSITSVINDSNIIISGNYVKLHDLFISNSTYAVNITGSGANLSDLRFYKPDYGISVNGSNSILNNINISENKYWGFDIYDATDQNERNSIISTVIGSEGMIFNEARTYVVRNATISSTDPAPTADIEILSAGAIVIVINSSFDTTTLIAGSRLYYKDFFDVEVEDAEGMYINATYPNGTQMILNAITDSEGKTEYSYLDYYSYLEYPDDTLTYYNPYTVTAKVPSTWNSGYYYVKDKVNNTIMPSTYGSIIFGGYDGRGYIIMDNATVTGTPIPDTGDWIIANYTTVANGTCWVTGNITINETGTLIANNVAIVTNSTSMNQFNIYINGTLELNNSLITYGANVTNRLMIIYQNTSATNYTTITNSAIQYTTIMIYNSRTNISNTAIKYSLNERMPGDGIYVENCTPTIENNSITGNGNGVSYLNATLDLKYNNLYNNALYGIYVVNSDGNIFHNTITHNNLGGIYTVNSTLNVSSNIINYNFNYGVRYTEASVVSGYYNHQNHNTLYLYLDYNSVFDSYYEEYNSTASPYTHLMTIYSYANFTGTIINNDGQVAIYGYGATITTNRGTIVGGSYSFMLKGNSHITLTGTTHNKNYDINDTASNITVKWYLTAHTTNGTTGLQTTIKIYDYLTNNITYQQTNATGWLQNIVLFEYDQNRSARRARTPHVLTAYRTTSDYRGMGKIAVDRNRYIPIDFANTYTNTLSTGWNLISFHITFPSDYTLSDLINEINGDGGDVTYAVTKESDGEYKSLTFARGSGIMAGDDSWVDSSKGYFIYTKRSVTITIQGTRVLDRNLTLVVGYNVVPIYHTNDLYTIADQIGFDNIDTITVRQNYYKTYRPNGDRMSKGRELWAGEGDAVFMYIKRAVTWETEI